MGLSRCIRFVIIRERERVCRERYVYREKGFFVVYIYSLLRYHINDDSPCVLIHTRARVLHQNAGFYAIFEIKIRTVTHTRFYYEKKKSRLANPIAELMYPPPPPSLFLLLPLLFFLRNEFARLTPPMRPMP